MKKIHLLIVFICLSVLVFGQTKATLKQNGKTIDMSSFQTKKDLLKTKHASFAHTTNQLNAIKVANPEVSTCQKDKQLKKSPISLMHQKNSVSNTNKNIETVIWQNNFSTPSSWVMTHSNYNPGNIATTANFSVVSAVPSNLVTAGFDATFNSTSGGNFALINSDLLGSSSYQNCYMRNATAINLSSYPNVKLTFQQYYARYADTCAVQVSTNSGLSWTTYLVNTTYGANQLSPNPETVEVNISAIAGGMPSVFIRFYYKGHYDWAWMIDDVKIEDLPAADANAAFLFTLGKLPQNTPHQAKALIINQGGQTLTNLNVTLNVTGANTFSNVQTIASLASGSQTEVTFSAYTCTSPGINTCTVSVPSDAVTTNNSFSYRQEITSNTIAYADTATQITGLGYGDADGILMCKYHMNGAHSVDVVNVYLSSDSGSIGKTVYGVVLSQDSIIIGLSNPFVVNPVDLETLHSFSILTPPTITGEDYYVGIIQISSGITDDNYYPLGVQEEPYDRSNAYYGSATDGTGIFEGTGYGRFFIEAELGTPAAYDAGVIGYSAPNTNTNCTLTANEHVSVTIKNFGINAIQNFPVSYVLNNGNPVTETVTTSIPANGTATYTFSTACNLSAFDYYLFKVYTSLNADANFNNDTILTGFYTGNATITVDVLTDDYPEETYWALYNLAGDIVATGGILDVYQANTQYSTDVCVSTSDCYTFIIFDDYGDGIAAPGYYEVFFDGISVGGNTNFGSSGEVINFIGEGCPAYDVQVDNVYTLGKLPIPSGAPHVVTALIYNNGTDDQTNLNVTLTISGANTFTNTQVVNLTSGSEMIVEFSGFTPANLGINNVTVSVPTDENNANNTASYYQIINDNTFSYADTSEVSGAIGFGVNDGLLLNKYFMNGTNNVVAVAAMISGDESSVGQTIYGVICDADTAVVGQSANYVIQTSDLGTMHTFTLSSPVSFTDARFFAGIAQLTGTVGFYPLSTQTEDPFTRDDAYFSATLDGDTTSSYTNLGRFMLDAIVDVVNLVDTQLISLSGGWKIISTYINPLDPNIVSVMSGITQYVTLVKNGTGNVYWPAYNINNIGNMVLGQGYQIRTTQAVSLYVIGDQVVPQNSPFNINQGWSIIGYLRNSPGLITTMLSSITGINLVKNGVGAVYWPAYSINNIGNMNPGEGYQINLLSAQVLTYPANTSPLKTSDNNSNSEILLPSTGSNMTIGIPVSSWEVAPLAGDEIIAYNSDGREVGKSIFNGENLALTVWGDDICTNNTDGMTDNQKVVLKIYNHSTNNFNDIIIESWLSGNDQYTENQISIADKLFISDYFSLMQNTPNPVNNITEIGFVIPEKSAIEINLYDASGNFAGNITKGIFEQGNHKVKFDVSQLSNGNYFYRMTSSKYSATRSMSVQK